MRRSIAGMAAAAAAVLAFSTAAWAGTTLETVGTVDFANDWIDGTNLLAKQDSSGAYALADMNGNVLSAGTYASLGYSAGYGFISASADAESVNSTGALNLSGEEIIPCAYGDVDFLNEHWIRAISLAEATADQYDYESWFSDGYYLIDTVDFYYADEDGTVTKAGSLPRANYLDSHAYGRYINIEDRSDNSIKTYDGTWTEVVTDAPASYVYDEIPGADDSVKTYYENGQYGLKDSAGNVILEPTYGYISSFYGGYAEVTNYLESGDASGLIDETGALAVPVEYESVEYAYYAPETSENGYSGYAYNNYGYFCVVKDGKLGYTDESGNVTCDFLIAKDNIQNYGASATYTDMSGARHLLSADGLDTDISQYSDVYAIEGGSGMYYKVTDENYDYGLIDWHGGVVAEVGYDNIDLSGDGQYLLLQKEYGAPCDLVRITYTPDSSAADEAAAQEGTEALTQTEGDETGADDSPAAADSSDVSSLIDSAIALASADAQANKEAIISLVQSVSSQIAQSNPDAKVVLDAVVTLLGNDPVDGASVTSMLTSVKVLLG